MKRIIPLILILCLILSMTAGSYALDMTDTKSKITDALSKIEDVVENIVDKLSDISNHWAKDFIASLTEKGIIGGYPDDTFRPDNKIKVTEFTVLVLKAKDVEIPTTEKWYQGAMDKAESEDIVKNGEFNSLDTRQINRGEMARMIVRALDENASSGDTWFKDDKNIPSSIKGYVKKASELGIIEGYPDGSFKHDGYATRAEASTMISKMIQVMNGETLPVQKPEVDFIEPEIEIVYNDDPYVYDYYYVRIKNYKDYEGKDEYEFNVISTNYPELNVQEIPHVKIVRIDYKILYRNSSILQKVKGRLYKLKESLNTTLELDKTFKLKPGMEIEHKITVTKGNERREYFATGTVPKINFVFAESLNRGE